MSSPSTIRLDDEYIHLESIAFDTHVPQNIIEYTKDNYNFSYSNQYTFETPEVKIKFEKECQRLSSAEDALIDWPGMSLFDASVTNKDKIISNLHNPNISLFIQKVDQRIGNGLFSKNNISKYAIIGFYNGHVSIAENKNSTSEYAMNAHFPGSKYVFDIDAKAIGNYTRFANHSSMPNLALIWMFYKNTLRTLLVTAKDIEPGEQLTFEYGTGYWANRNPSEN